MTPSTLSTSLLSSRAPKAAKNAALMSPINGQFSPPRGGRGRQEVLTASTSLPGGLAIFAGSFCYFSTGTDTVSLVAVLDYLLAASTAPFRRVRSSRLQLLHKSKAFR